MLYKALDEILKKEIHAIQIKALNNSEDENLTAKEA